MLGATVASRHASTLIPWVLAAALTLVAVVLGLLGLSRYFDALGTPRTHFALAYLTLQLFVLNLPDLTGPVPWQLEVARFLAPGVAAYTAVRGLAILFREQLEGFRMRRLRGHVVVCALGRKGLELARALLARGERVAVVELNAESDRIAPCRADGGLVLVGDARSRRTLRRAGILRARAVVALSADDGTNAEIAVQARSLAAERPGRPLLCVAHVVDPRLCELLRTREIEHRPDDAFHVEFFNAFERGAAELLREHPVVGTAARRAERAGHMVVVGGGRFGESLVVEAARQWRLAQGIGAPPLRVTFVDRAAGAKARALTERHPQVARTCELCAVGLEFASAEFHAGRFLLEPDGRCTATAAYVCVDDDSAGLSAALALNRHLKPHGVPIVVRMAHEGGLAVLLRARPGDGDDFGLLRAFGLIERTCSPEVVLGGTREVLARAIHDDYVRQQRERGATPASNPSMVPWEELPESLRESNREQAAHIGVKLGAVGRAVAPLADEDEEPFAFAPEEVERLARMEHDRWVEERRRAGWVLAAEKDVERKRSPYLVPWEELDEPTREHDRAFVRGLPRFLAVAGFRIVEARPPRGPAP
jgi:hypothetical protein